MTYQALDRTDVPTSVEGPDTLAGRYQLGDRIGRGSSATVYEATDLRLGRPVAVKVFDPALADDPSSRERFQTQTAKAARLSHPHIGAVLDAGIVPNVDGGETAFVVTEPLGPLSLRGLLDRERRLSPARAVRFARQIATALSYAHRHHVIHADVKPENVLVAEAEGSVKLVDFALSFVSAVTGAIRPDTIVRRAAYLAPEQVRGELVTPSADVYALGVLLYEMIVGRPPFTGDSPNAIAERHVREQAQPVGSFDPSIPPTVERVINRALDRMPQRRWASMDDLVEALERLEGDELKPVSVPAGEGAAPASVAPPPHGFRGPYHAIWPKIALVLGLGAFFYLYSNVAGLIGGLPQFTDRFGVTIPNVEGKSVSEAQAVAQQRGLELAVIGERESDRHPRGVVIQQSPVSGWRPTSSQPVRVTVSSGVTVPDLRGKALADAHAIASAAGWRIARADRAPAPGRSSGSVLIQHPPPGEVAAVPGELALVVVE